MNNNNNNNNTFFEIKNIFNDKQFHWSYVMEIKNSNFDFPQVLNTNQQQNNQSIKDINNLLQDPLRPDEPVKKKRRIN